MAPALTPANTIALSASVSLSVYVATARDVASLPVLLFLPFWGGTKNTYRKMVPHLSSRYSLICPTLRGWGNSAGPDDSLAYGIADYASDIVLLMQSLDQGLFKNGLVLVGHSMGGKIAQYLAAQMSRAVGRLSDEIKLRGLVLLSPAPMGSFALPQQMRAQQREAYLTGLDVARFAVQNVLLGQSNDLGTDDIEALVQDVLSGRDEAKRGWIDYGMAEDWKILLDECLEEVQMLVVIGDEDKVEPRGRVEKEVIELWRAAGAIVSFKTLPGVGHLLPVEAPVQVAKMIEDFVGALK
ncbi:MAG: hypothetical protein MMC23_000014 [Stictis urceolatum]|nr:hypothetical protein [Stictis urceolata]